jgi:DNA replicative helicase MCM subunit Mcm2 (Cdc46/Mcm family)
VEDAEVVIGLMGRALSRAGYDPQTGKVDIMVVEAGKPVSREIKRTIVENILKNQIEPYSLSQVVDILEDKGMRLEREEVNKILNHIAEMGYAFKPYKDLWVHLLNEKRFKYKREIYKGDVHNE